MVTVESKLQTEAPKPTPAAPRFAANVERVVMTGYMGAGKTTVGRALAAETGLEFLDLDHLIEARHGKTIAALFQELGEPGFRKLETQELASVLGRKGVVIALGGGAIESLTNRLLLEQKPKTVVVFLDAPFGILFDRCVLQPDAAIRPVLQNPEVAEARFKARHPHYKRAAKVIVETEQLTVPETVAHLIEQFRTL